MLNREELQELAKLRLKEAEILFDAKLYGGAHKIIDIFKRRRACFFVYDYVT